METCLRRTPDLLGGAPMAAEPSTPAGPVGGPRRRPRRWPSAPEQVAPLLREHLTLTARCLPFAGLAEQVGTEVLVKCEHLQRTGSFKARGSLAKVAHACRRSSASGAWSRRPRATTVSGWRTPLAALGGRGHRVRAGDRLTGEGSGDPAVSGAEVRAQGTDSGRAGGAGPPVRRRARAGLRVAVQRPGCDRWPGPPSAWSCSRRPVERGAGRGCSWPWAAVA